MSIQNNYKYISTVLLYSSIFYFILFLIFNFFNFNYVTVFSQSFFTIFFFLLILCFITYNSRDNNDFKYPQLFGLTFVAAIPLFYHLFFIIYFKNYSSKSIDSIKSIMAIVLIFYFSLIWYNVYKSLISNNLNKNNIINSIINILFTIVH
jgi:hypothetical protein